MDVRPMYVEKDKKNPRNKHEPEKTYAQVRAIYMSIQEFQLYVSTFRFNKKELSR